MVWPEGPRLSGKSEKWLLPLIICYFLYILFFRLQIFCTREGIEGHYSVTRRLFRIRWRTTPRPPIILQNGARICLLFWPLKVSTFRWNLISDFPLLTFQHLSRIFICSNGDSLCSNHVPSTWSGVELIFFFTQPKAHVLQPQHAQDLSTRTEWLSLPV